MSLRAGKWADHLQADLPPPPWRQTPFEAETPGGKDPSRGRPPVNRQTLLKTLPSLAVGKYNLHSLVFHAVCYEWHSSYALDPPVNIVWNTEMVGRNTYNF